MKVLVKNLLPNPYRRIDKYPIDKQKVESLKNSISETGFWDNIMARPNPEDKKTCQIAYGHHRLQAIKEIGITEVDIPVKDLQDAIMLKMMVDENMDVYNHTTAMILESISVAKEYLEGELAKYETWEDVSSDKSIRCVFKDSRSFQECKTKGIGRDIIKKFLGDNWKEWQIQEALKILNAGKDGTLDVDALTKEHTKLDTAHIVADTLIKNNVPKKAQKSIMQLAKEKKESEEFSEKEVSRSGGTPNQTTIRKAAVEAAIRQTGLKTKMENFHKTFPDKQMEKKELPEINSGLLTIAEKLETIFRQLENAFEYRESIDKGTKKLLLGIAKRIVNIIEEGEDIEL
jgi:hypothetical protein